MLSYFVRILEDQIMFSNLLEPLMSTLIHGWPTYVSGMNRKALARTERDPQAA